MYRKLESRNDKLEAVERKTEGICHCACKGAQAKEGPPQPEVNLTGNKVALDSAVSG